MPGWLVTVVSWPMGPMLLHYCVGYDILAGDAPLQRLPLRGPVPLTVVHYPHPPLMDFGGADAFFFVLLKNSERNFSSDYCCLHFLDVDGFANCSAICSVGLHTKKGAQYNFHGRSFCYAFLLQWRFVLSPKKGSLVADDARPRSSP
jgi:hypothetical protein